MAAKDNLPDIDLNAAFRHEYTWYSEDPDTGVKSPIDLTDYEGKLQIKKTVDDAVALITWSTANNRMVIESNRVRIFVPYSEVITYTTFEDGVFDLLIWPNSDLEDVTCLVRGEVVAVKGITVR